MPRRKVANPLALAVLACLAERPMHPYEMAATMRERGKDESIKLNYGSLYSVIDALKKHALIAAQETARDGNRPERTVYALTEAGRWEMTDWLSQLLAEPAKEYTQFEAGLTLMPAVSPDAAAALLEQRAIRLTAEIADIHARLGHAYRVYRLPRLFLIETEYRLALREAELAFVRALAADVASGQLEGAAMWRSWYEGGSAPRIAPPAIAAAHLPKA